MGIEKYERDIPNKRKKRVALIICLVLLLSLTVGGTLAYIAVKTVSVQNQFESASVTCDVIVGDTDNQNAIMVQNTGNVDAYIRAAIVVNWMDEDGNVRGIAPTIDDYELGINTTAWTYASGFYYYVYPGKEKVAPDAVTYYLINYADIKPNIIPPSGYTLSVEVIAEAIQADGVTDDTGTSAVQDAWFNPLTDDGKAILNAWGVTFPVN